jgi:chromosome segregation ATPase
MAAMLFRNLDVTPNTVQIDEDVVERPSYVSVGQWTEFWENAKDEHSYDAGYEEGLAESKRELDELESEKEALEDEIADLQKKVNDLEAELNDTLNRFDKEYDRGFQDGLGADDS